MSLTDALAVIGAATGTTGSILGAMAYRRDRSRVTLELGSGKALAHDSLLLKIRLRNAGRQPTTITRVSVLRSGRRGLATLLRLWRFSWLHGPIQRVGRFQGVADPLEVPLVLEPNDRQEYVLRAKALDESAGRSFTYVCAVDISNRIIARRARMEVDVEAWESFD